MDYSNVIDETIIDFLIRAKKSTYANSAIENFDGIEQIYKENNLIYELHCSGGIIK